MKMSSMMTGETVGQRWVAMICHRWPTQFTGGKDAAASACIELPCPEQRELLAALSGPGSTTAAAPSAAPSHQCAQCIELDTLHRRDVKDMKGVSHVSGRSSVFSVASGLSKGLEWRLCRGGRATRNEDTRTQSRVAQCDAIAKGHSTRFERNTHLQFPFSPQSRALSQGPCGGMGTCMWPCAWPREVLSICSPPLPAGSFSSRSALVPSLRSSLWHEY